MYAAYAYIHIYIYAHVIRMYRCLTQRIYRCIHSITYAHTDAQHKRIFIDDYICMHRCIHSITYACT